MTAVCLHSGQSPSVSGQTKRIQYLSGLIQIQHVCFHITPNAQFFCHVSYFGPVLYISPRFSAYGQLLIQPPDVLNAFHFPGPLVPFLVFPNQRGQYMCKQWIYGWKTYRFTLSDYFYSSGSFVWKLNTCILPVW